MTAKYETFVEIPDELAEDLILFIKSVENQYYCFDIFCEAIEFLYPEMELDAIFALWYECRDEAEKRSMEEAIGYCPHCKEKAAIFSPISFFCSSYIECTRCGRRLFQNGWESDQDFVKRWQSGEVDNEYE